MIEKFIHKPWFRKFFITIFGKNRFFWKFVEMMLRFLKMQNTPCIFCKIVRGEVSTKKVYEDDSVLAFHDINPQAPVHILVIPKKHIPTFIDINEEDKDILMNIVNTCKKIAKDMNIDEKGFRIIINTNPHGGQTVYHLHLHMLGGRQMRWPPG